MSFVGFYSFTAFFAVLFSWIAAHQGKYTAAIYCLLWALYAHFVLFRHRKELAAGLAAKKQRTEVAH